MVKKPSTTSVMGKMMIRNILNSWLQFLAIIFITGLAVTLYVGLTSNATSISNRVSELYSGGNIADIWTTVTGKDAPDYDVIDNLTGEGGKTEKRFAISSILNSMNATALISKDYPTINKPYSTDNTVTEDFFIIDERLLETETRAVSLKWRDAEGNYLKVPVNISFSAFQSALNNTPIFDKTAMDVFYSCLKTSTSVNIFDDSYLNVNLQITGTMMFAENVQSSLMNNSSFLLDQDYFFRVIDSLCANNFAIPELPDPSSPDYEWIKTIRDEDLLTRMIDSVKNGFSVNQYVSKVGSNKDVVAVRESIEKYFSHKIDNNLLSCIDVNKLASNVTIQSDIKQANQLAYIFPMIFFLVAILVVLTTLSQTILKDRTQIGTMKAIGISSKRIISHYLCMCVVVVSIGVLIGIGIGPFILPAIMNQKYTILYTLPMMGYSFAILEALLSSALCILLAALVTYLIIRKEAVLKPAESMRPATNKGFKVAKIERKERKNARFISWKMAFRNIRVYKVKSLMVIIGVIGCTALLVCGFGIDDTLNYGVRHDISHFYSADITTTYAVNTSLASDILTIEGVDEVEEVATLPTTLTSDKTYQSYCYCIPDHSKFFILDDNYVLEEDIAMSSKIASSLGVAVGDEISFSVLGENYTGKVGFILDVFYVHGIYINSVYYPKVYEKKTTGYVSVKDGYDHEEVGKLINEVDGIASYKTKEENIKMINDYMGSISLMTLAVKTFAILLAVIVLYNLALLNYRERIRDIATLKVLGFTRGEIARSLIFEVMALTVVGIAGGLLLGKPLEVLVLMVNRTPLVDFLYTVYPLTYLYSFLITFGTAFVVNVFLSNKTKSVKMVESLKSIE